MSVRKLLSTVFYMLALLGWAAQPERRFDSIAEIRAFPQDDQHIGHPVCVRGVVTFNYPHAQGGLVVDDETAGIYVQTQGPPFLEVGCEAVITGRVAQGKYAPVINAENIQILGTKPLPPAAQPHMSELYTGLLDCQRVRVEGVVVHVKQVSISHLDFMIKTREGMIMASLFGNHDFASFSTVVDARVRVEGICFAVFNSRAELAGAQIRVSDAESIKVLALSITDPFNAPKTVIDQLLPFSTEGPVLHRRRIQGVVSAVQDEQCFFVQIGKRGLRIEMIAGPIPTVGDMVEISGFINDEDFFAGFHYAHVRVEGGHYPLDVTPVTYQDVLQHPSKMRTFHPDYHGRVVSCEGWLRGMEMQAEGAMGHKLLLEVDGHLLDIHVGQMKLDLLVSGSRLRVTGVCVMQFAERRPIRDYPQVKGFSLIARAPEDIKVLIKPTWWTVRRLAAVTAGLMGVLVVILLWNASLRIQVTRKTEESVAQNRARLEAELRTEERSRLAAELHDALAQTLTGVAMQFDAAESARTTSPERVFKYIETGKRLLQACRNEIRNCIVVLRGGIIDRVRFADALYQIKVLHEEGSSARIIVETQGVLPVLPEYKYHSLLRVAQEAIGNAVRHAQAEEIFVRVIAAPNHIELTVSDNGRGFLLETAPGHDKGHFGLSNMAERVERMDGTFELISKPREGTLVRIRLDAVCRV
jgi:signal transduction histidine kinase